MSEYELVSVIYTAGTSIRRQSLRVTIRVRFDGNVFAQRTAVWRQGLWSFGMGSENISDQDFPLDASPEDVGDFLGWWAEALHDHLNLGKW